MTWTTEKTKKLGRGRNTDTQKGELISFLDTTWVAYKTKELRGHRQKGDFIHLLTKIKVGIYRQLDRHRQIQSQTAR
jgi:hypothetical protein